MTLAQWTLDAGLRLEGATGVRRLGLEAVSAARKVQLRLHDPLVTYQIGQIALHLPLSHQLPYYRRTFPQYSSSIGRIGAAVEEKYPDLTLIDVGANVGDTVAIARQAAHYPILCVEGSTVYLPLLYRNVNHLGDVEIEAAFVGGTSGPVAASLRMAGGTAHLAMGGSDEGTISLSSLEEIVRRHPRFASAKLMKSDTDGMDCQIIAGAADYLAAVRPALFFEYDPDLTARAGATAIRVFDVLDAAGYRYALVYENTGGLMLLLDLHDKRLLSDLDAFFSGRNGRGGLLDGRYADICAFHETDSDLAFALHKSEGEFFRALRGNVDPPSARLRTLA
jgi:FkbM family methyltransferase